MSFVFFQKRSHRNSFCKDDRGVAMIEFAFLVPILALMFYGIVEVSRYIQVHQKLDNAASTLLDLLNQNLNLTLDSINTLVDTVPAMIAPYDASDIGVIITSIQVPQGSTTPTTLWQVTSGNIRAGSRISSGKGDEPDLPQLPLVERDQVLTVEIFLQYRPLVNNDIVRTILGLTPEGLYKVSIARPRYGSFQFEPK